MQPLWQFVNQHDETQLDFFDLCEPETSTLDSDLGSQVEDEGNFDDKTQE